MHLQQIDVTGCRLVGAITKDLGMDGPKHHAVVLGRSVFDGEVYIAELMDTGPQISTCRDRKSTRLNSSHTVISYAVFCLKSEEHTSELQSHSDLVCRLLLDKEKHDASI